MAKVLTRRALYEHWTANEKRMFSLGGAFISVITPFTDTVYLPAMKNIAMDLKANDAQVAVTVSVYLAAIAFGQMLWGPLSDYFGRRKCLFVVLTLYIGITVGIIFAPDINVLIILRSLQGLFVGSTVCTVQAIMGDVFAPEERGAAMATVMGSLLIGPVIAPLIGGALSESSSWRSCFILLAAMAAGACYTVCVCLLCTIVSI